jgi:hypothetical protein
MSAFYNKITESNCIARYIITINTFCREMDNFLMLHQVEYIITAGFERVKHSNGRFIQSSLWYNDRFCKAFHLIQFSKWIATDWRNRVWSPVQANNYLADRDSAVHVNFIIMITEGVALSLGGSTAEAQSWDIERAEISSLLNVI